MSDEKKNFAAPTTRALKKRPSTTASTSRPKTVGSLASTKEKAPPRTKLNRNSTVAGDADTTILQTESVRDFDAECQIAYSSFLRTMLEECLVDEKVEREENHMDSQMAQLSNRFLETTKVLDKTYKRLKDISFVVEQKRLIDMKNRDCSRFYETIDASDAQDMLQNLSNAEQACLDKLETKNIDFGYNKDCGYKQLLDAVNDALDGLEHIKKHSNLDVEKFKEYEKSQKGLDDLEKDRLDLESLKADFEAKFPKFSEKLLMEASEKIAKMIENDD